MSYYRALNAIEICFKHLKNNRIYIRAHPKIHVPNRLWLVMYLKLLSDKYVCFLNVLLYCIHYMNISNHDYLIHVLVRRVVIFLTSYDTCTVYHCNTNQFLSRVAERSKALGYEVRAMRRSESSETYISILNVALTSRSSSIGDAHTNEIKVYLM